MALDIQPKREMPSKVGKIRQKNEAMILEAATDEFILHGFRGASIRGIAERSGVPKANVLYYFGSKLGIYAALLEGVLNGWLDSFSSVANDKTPEGILTKYIHDKVDFSRDFPKKSRIFASEIIHGAPNLQRYFEQDLREWLNSRTTLMKQWVADGLMDDLEPAYVLFLIWGATQHYADFESQVTHVVGHPLSEDDYEEIKRTLCHIVLKGCGISSR